MSMAYLLTNCPSCGAQLNHNNEKPVICPKCNKIIRYASDKYAVDTSNMEAEILVKVEDERSIVLFPFKGVIRVMTGNTKHGVVLMFESDQKENKEEEPCK